MTKKGLLLLGSIVLAVGIGMMFQNSKKTTTGQQDAAVVKQIARHIPTAKELHSEFLRTIASGEKAVCNITPENAQKELEERAGMENEADSNPPNVRQVHFEILQMIAKSPTSLAGIQPRQALSELLRRYLSIDLGDSDDVNTSILLEALHRLGENKAIEEWSENEDAEAVAAFLEQIADEDPSSIANIAYGLRHWNDMHTNAIDHFRRYADNVHIDAFDNVDEERSFNLMVTAVKDLIAKEPANKDSSQKK